MALPLRILMQIGLVALLVSMITLVTDRVNFRSPWNLLWMLGIPFGVARGFHRDLGVWPLAGLWLLIWGFAVMMATAALFNLGP